MSTTPFLLPITQLAGGRAELVPHEVIKELSVVSTARGVALVLFQYLAIAVVIAVCESHFSWWTYPISVVLIGSRLLAMVSLVHDGVHWRLARHKGFNDFLNEMLLCFPLVESAERNRVYHLAHHRHFKTGRDPERERFLGQEESRFSRDFRGYPKSLGAVTWMVFRNVSGLAFFEMFYELKRVSTRENKLEFTPKYSRLKLAGYLSLAVIFSAYGLWLEFFLYYFVPVCTWAKLCLQLRALSNHFGMEETANPYSGTRTLIASYVEQMLVCPYFVGHHLDHHLYPSVPCYRLGALHRELLKHPEYRNNAHLTRGIWALLMELAGRGDPRTDTTLRFEAEL
ncbi:MAG: fatty acid desaturase family protein [Nannocystaceae bacterium]|nr:fatty acid desaturase family protein [Nannocystaceae bacterium]